MYFLLTFLLTISPRKSTQSVHQIAQFQSQKCKSSFVWQGGHPLPDPPPARALRALACVFPTILQILPPTDREIFCSCPPWQPTPVTPLVCRWKFSLSIHAPTYMSFHTDKISEVPRKILKEIAVFKCENATKKNPRARSHALLVHIL